MRSTKEFLTVYTMGALSALMIVSLFAIPAALSWKQQGLFVTGLVGFIVFSILFGILGVSGRKPS